MQRRARARACGAAVVTALVVGAAAAPPGSARGDVADAGAQSAPLAGVPSADPPLALPPVAGAARRTAATWIIGAAPGARAAALARHHGARALSLPGTYAVPTSRARDLAGALRARGALRYAEPDVALAKQSALDVAPDGWARGAVVPSALAPPAPGPETVAVVDEPVDAAHPDLAGHVRPLNDAPLTGVHGTQVASAAAGAANGSGVLGVFPGAPLLTFGLQRLTCTEVSEGILTAARERPAAINLSLGSPRDCFTLFRAVQVAFGSGSVIVAAAGNEFAEGNPVQFPAAYPHVVSVASVDPALASSAFSNANLAVDMSAPGEAVPVAVPASLDDAGTADGVALADGTSFAAPMVAGAAAWIATVRPDLDAGQIGDVLRMSARDLAEPGWDADTGFGLLDVPAALSSPAPAADVLEPNDGVAFVDGTAFARPDPFIWSGGRARTLRSVSVDQIEDPVDVYRARIPARSAARVDLRPLSGDPDLAVYRGTARSLSRRALIRASLRGPGRRDVVTIRNTARRSRVVYIAVGVPAQENSAATARYALTVSRRRL